MYVIEANSLPSKYHQSEWKKIAIHHYDINFKQPNDYTNLKKPSKQNTSQHQSIYPLKIIDNAEGEGPARVRVGVQTQDVIS